MHMILEYQFWQKKKKNPRPKKLFLARRKMMDSCQGD